MKSNQNTTAWSIFALTLCLIIIVRITVFPPFYEMTTEEHNVIYNNHHYVIIKADGRYVGVVHDPDCTICIERNKR